MKLNNFSLTSFSDSARKQFSDLQNTLQRTHAGFQTKLRGKTTGRLIWSIICTLLWAAGIYFGLSLVKDMVPGLVLTVISVAMGVLLLAMLIDELTSLSYYGKIDSYAGQISQLYNRLEVGKSSLHANNETFKKAEKSGWDLHLTLASSISEEAAAIEETISNMETLKRGFIHGLKNVFFFGLGVVLTLAGSLVTYEFGMELLDLSGDVSQIICVIATILAAIGMVILCKLVWGATDCSVTNVTLLILLAAPVSTLALVALVALVIVVVAAVLQIALYLLALVIAGSFVFGSTCGG